MTVLGMAAVIAVTGIIASYIAMREEAIARTPHFRQGALSVFLLLLIITTTCGQGLSVASIAEVLALAASALTWTPFVVMYIVYFTSSMTRSALSLDDMIVRPTYSQAEAAEARRRYDEALQLYRQGAAQFPQDPEPHRRMAELFLVLNRIDDAERAFRHAIELQTNAEDKMLLVFSLAETIADRRHDLPAAIAILEDFRVRYPQVAGLQYLDERLARLRERVK